jgi:hypothetical protein
VDSAGRHITVRLSDYVSRGIEPKYKTLPWQADLVVSDPRRKSDDAVKLRSVPISRHAAHQRRGAADRGQYRQAAGLVEG